MNNSEIIVVYSWTANEGKAEELQTIYKEVSAQMKANEPDANRVECYFDSNLNKLVVIDFFKNAEAVGFHLGTTANNHFGSLLQIAKPGPFLFCGDIPEAIQTATKEMGLDATFAPHQFGFTK
ncbi:hypothetical protein OAQ99_07260 [Candidatus Kapabacteria bacterium]|nr:hypothetical protein [Candidatus Kapabacteria bacterium]